MSWHHRHPLLESGKYGEAYADPEKVMEMAKALRAMKSQGFDVKALDEVTKNKTVIIIPSWYKLFWWLGRLSRSLELRLTQKNCENMSRMLHEQDPG